MESCSALLVIDKVVKKRFKLCSVVECPCKRCSINFIAFVSVLNMRTCCEFQMVVNYQNMKLSFVMIDGNLFQIQKDDNCVFLRKRKSSHSNAAGKFSFRYGCNISLNNFHLLSVSVH